MVPSGPEIAPGQDAILRLEKLTLTCPPAERPLVDGVDLEVAPNARLALIGASGSGKTLTSLACLGLLPKAIHHISGQIFFHGKAVLDDQAFNEVRGKGIAMVFQSAKTALNPVRKIGHQLTDVLSRHQHLDRKAMRERALKLLMDVELTPPDSIFNAYVHELSGGMAQRAMLALVLACQPQVIIADEPTSALDPELADRMLLRLTTLQERRRFALLLITHDISIAGRYCDQLIVMHAGKIIESGSANSLLHNPQHSFTRTLVAAADSSHQHSGIL